MTFLSRVRWGPALSLACIVLGGAALRAWQVNESLWLDELHTSWVVADGAGEVGQRARSGNQSPLYFWLVWAVVQWCGHTVWALRLLSLISGTALIAGLAWLVWRWSGVVGSGLVAALLVTFNRDCIFYAQEARPYALVQLSAVCHAAIFVAMLKRPTWRNRGMFVAGAAWLFYLHYTAFLFLLAEACCALIVRLWRPGWAAYRGRQAVVDAALIATLLLPSLPHLWQIAHRRENWARIVEAWPLPYGLQVALVLCGAVPAATVALRALVRRSPDLPRHLGLLNLWAACWFLVPLSLAWLSTLAHVAALCMVRYLVASVLGAVVFAALCHGLLCEDVAEAGPRPSRPLGNLLSLLCSKRVRGRWWGRLLACFLVGGTVYASGIVPQLDYDGRVIGDRNEAWDRATNWLQEELQQTQKPVFLCAGLVEDRALEERADDKLAEYCLFPFSGIYRLPASHLEPLPTTERVTLTPGQRELVRRYGGLWLVIRASPGTTKRIVSAVTQDLRSAGLSLHVVETHHFGSLTVIRLDKP